MLPFIGPTWSRLPTQLLPYLPSILCLSIIHLPPTHPSTYLLVIHLPTCHLSVHPSIIYPSIHLSIVNPPFTYLTSIICLSIHLYPSIHPSITYPLSTHLSSFLSSIHPLTCYTIYPSTHPSIHPFIIHSLPTINHSLLFCPYICLPTSHLQPATCPSVYLSIIHSHTSSSVF